MTSGDASTCLAEGLGSTLAAQLETYAERLRALAEQLSDDQFWTKPYPYGNSVGHLVLHVTGNLNYYLGTQIAGTGYVRNRPLEFSDESRRPKQDVLAALHAAVTMAAATIRSQTAADWLREYQAAGTDEPNRIGIILRCVAHLFHHQAQIIYLVKEHQRQQG
jgi:hypothetical protein